MQETVVKRAQQEAYRRGQVEALREAVRDMRTARRKSWTWTLPDPLDPEAVYSVDTWLEIRTDRIAREAQL